MTKEARATLEELQAEMDRLRKVVDAAIACRNALPPPSSVWGPSLRAFTEAVDAYLAERGE